MTEVHDLFQTLMGKAATPYPYQERTADSLIRGESVLLSAPTGAGKTWAALLGYLAGLREDRPHADRVLYALPLRTLATGLFQSTETACARVKDWGKGRPPAVAIQTGEEKQDPFFQGDIVFTTIDQLLAGYLQIPLSIPRRLANINAGALVGSLLVLDEVHLLDPARSLATVMEMGRRLKGLAQFLLMTATLSRPAREALADYFAARLEGPTPKELADMPSQADKERRYRWVPRMLTAEEVLAAHEGKRSLAICNTVHRAQELYHELTARMGKGRTKVFLLHSRFLPEDRRAAEAGLAAYFGPEAELSDAILVATQVVEAGLDISAESLHTELCPANALVQRAGRCARFPARNKGQVFIYELPRNEKGNPVYSPYTEAEIRSTREAVRDLAGEILGFAEEQELVDLVHARRELELIQENRRNLQGLLPRRILQTMAGNDRSSIGDLIRDVDSVGVVVAEDPSPVDLLGGLVSIPVPRSSILGLKELLLGGGPTAWIPEVRQEREDERDLTDWRPVRDEIDLKSAWLLALSPRIAGYSGEVGLELGKSGDPTGINYKARPLRPAARYECETYRQHVERTLRAVRAMRRRAAENRLAGLYRWRTDDLERLLLLAAGLHDLGKLSRRWQAAVKAWQYDNYPHEGAWAAGEPLGHSTYREENHDAERERNPRYDRGTHAAEGAAAASPLLAAEICRLFADEEQQFGAFSAVLSAIARHHSPQTEEIEEYRLIPEAEKEVVESLAAELGFSEAQLEKAPDQRRRHETSRFFVGFDGASVPWLPLYWHLVRWVRLADQEAVRLLLDETERR